MEKYVKNMQKMKKFNAEQGMEFKNRKRSLRNEWKAKKNYTLGRSQGAGISLACRQMMTNPRNKENRTRPERPFPFQCQ